MLTSTFTVLVPHDEETEIELSIGPLTLDVVLEFVNDADPQAPTVLNASADGTDVTVTLRNWRSVQGV